MNVLKQVMTLLVYIAELLTKYISKAFKHCSNIDIYINEIGPVFTLYIKILLVSLDRIISYLVNALITCKRLANMDLLPCCS